MCPSKHDAKSSNLALRATACKNAASSYVHALNLPIRVPEDPIYFLWRPYLRDRNDEMVLELAVAARCDYIITYNQRDFSGAEKFGIRVIGPRPFLQEIGELP